MRNATTVGIFAVLAGVVLALPAPAEAQNSSTLKTEPVSAIATDRVTGSCSSSSLVKSTSPAFGGVSVGFSTPRDADALALSQGTSEVSANQRMCVVGECVGQKAGSSCGNSGQCRAYAEVVGGYACYCREQQRGPDCVPRGQRGCD